MCRPDGRLVLKIKEPYKVFYKKGNCTCNLDGTGGVIHAVCATGC